MLAPLTHLKVFLGSLLFSLSWLYYRSTYFIDLLGSILLCAATAFLGCYCWQILRPEAQTNKTNYNFLNFINTACFFSLVFGAESISSIHFQYSFSQFLVNQAIYLLAYASILFAAWKIRHSLGAPLLQIPMLFCSGLLLYELYLTSTQPTPNQTMHLAPVMRGSFISYSGGNGRLINSHFAIPQRRYLTPVVPGKQSFRPPEQNSLARRIQNDFGTEILAPIDGEVVNAIDTLPDLAPGILDDSHPPGNHLCLKTKHGHYLYLANFQQDSMTVKVGDQVHAGQTLGRIGKNGVFTESALVILLVDNPDVIAPTTRSLPFYFQNADGTRQFPKRNQRMSGLKASSQSR
ncbi:M23 family metallopeptidase [Coraliomargarita sp. SDUM461003]|uniref:M23 family metallopeptidase n=1 Tax=Thalassobacterium maritimum TaxID=3041265 RepID=A0ABU1AVT6_9BACT|nr:M23 family metallopeptidase [Coraliomargarita sp. SDUM461003]MDQ8207097.1 M23 family metallopeptidase [Coraliomargarita sp. SDUM461003]